jgi:integrase
MAARRKKFDAPPPVVVATTPIPEDEGGAVVFIGENASNVRTIDLTPWLNRGIDDWVWVCAGQLRTFLRSKRVAPTTVAYYGDSLQAFFEFLTSSGSPPYRPEALDGRRMEQYVAWLKDQRLNDRLRWKDTSQKNRYAHTKSVLVGLMARGVIRAGREIFPRNPFPNSNAKCKGEKAFSPTERVRLAEAMRDDIVAVHKGRWQGTESEALTVHMLALAFRTGLNPTPMLELTRDCLRPHPFMPTMMIIESFKRRGNATHLKNLRFSRKDEDMVSIPMDGVALFRKVLERTQPLADLAPKDLRDRVWLYVSEGNNTKGKLRKLTKGMLHHYTQAIIDRHGLLSDDGVRLRVNASRLRKTFENRLWHLSNGDLFTVAGIMGHTPDVADRHYLQCTSEMRKNATFVGEALPDIYRGTYVDQAADEQNIVPIRSLENTPVGSCKDSLNGDKAPKDGTHCADFFRCFSCRSYAIVGSKKDLHRLFSFYWFLDTERQRARSREWVEEFTAIMTLIDAVTQDKCDAALVDQAKESARVGPLSFWKSYRVEEGGLVENGKT